MAFQEKTKLENYLNLPRCPHCGTDKPSLAVLNFYDSVDANNAYPKRWAVYRCSRCGMLVSAYSYDGKDKPVVDYFPSIETVEDAVPADAKDFLEQAIETLRAPSGSILLSASAIDSMLKSKGYTAGSLYDRIKEASAKNVLTEEMALWAHKVRLDANAQRHADGSVKKPTMDDAKHTLEFAKALAQFLFVLPAKVRKGIEETPEPPVIT